jgi:trk system potassium uptake protein
VKQTRSDPPRESLYQPTVTKLRGPARVPAAARLISGLAIMVVIGTFILSLPGMTTRPLTLIDRLFTATSAVTVTGLAVTTTSTDFTLLGQTVLLLLIQTGGLGFVVLVVLTLLLIGRPLTLTDRLALTSEMGLAKPGAIKSILGRTILVMIVIETIGAVLLYLHWYVRGIVPADDALFYAVFHSIAAFCNAGFDLFFGLPRYPGGLPNDILTMLILGVLVILGGLGTPVYMDLLFKGPSRRLSLTSRVTVSTAIILITVGMIGILIGEHQQAGTLTEVLPIHRVVIAWFQSVSARTAGFPGLQSFDQLHQSSRLLLVVLMFIGSGPASMGGGITTGTFAVLGLALIGFAKGSRNTILFRRTISPGTVNRATAILLVSLGVVGLATWLLLLTHPLSLDRALFEVVSAYATVGLSLSVTPELNDFGRLLITFVMFWGRLGAMTIMVVLLQRRAESNLIAYPEETLLVG